MVLVISNDTISWLRRRAGLFFDIRAVRSACCPLLFTICFMLFLILTGGCGMYGGVLTVYAEQEAAAAEIPAADEPIAEDLAADTPIIVVIDPGHGGDNLGGEYEDYTEKEMTLIVAKAMKAELEQYEGIEVYLTRTDDIGLTLEERCEYAASLNADFLFCLHFNMSTYHTLFGAETWISAFGEQYSKGYAFASIEMELLQEMGLYSRGIKTRLNDSGIDYYGIIRHSTERNMPCVLIEHCHLDQENDKPFYDHQEKLETFGRLDAEAVAKYFGLKSESLGKDFSNYQAPVVPIPTQTMKPDATEPDVCMIDLVEQDMENGDVTISVSADDYDSGMLYYTYSYDGGMTFSDLQKWPDKTKDTFEFTITIPSGVVPQMVVNAYNGYDLYTTSNTLNLPSMNYGEKEIPDKEDLSQSEEPAADDKREEGSLNDEAVESLSDSVLSEQNEEHSSSVMPSGQAQEPQPMTMGYFVKVCLVCALLVFAMALSILIILKSYKKERRRRK